MVPLRGGSGGGGALLRAARRFHVMKDSWTSLPPPPDPSKPSVARIVREMDRTKTQQAGAAPGDVSSGSLPEGQGAGDTRRHSARLPETYLPSAASTPAAAAPRVPLRVGAGGHDPRRPPIPGAGGPGGGNLGSQWRPPGWEAFEKRAGPEGMRPAPRRVKRSLESERPAIEVWGVRLLGLIIFGIIGVHTRDYLYGPTGIRRAKPRIIGPDETE
eukprot:TRINITY_DN64128_c0_g1_i1.p2 TRINITY_DN64128_c0_g1~~TRINITY_DN64128_c0_g1_i1.p2  ORF type:complete len:234 (+),score=24.01 TRINITY_DN64128_c0_g1_i1:60-704(+)